MHLAQKKIIFDDVKSKKKQHYLPFDGTGIKLQAFNMRIEQLEY